MLSPPDPEILLMQFNQVKEQQENKISNKKLALIIGVLVFVWYVSAILVVLR